MTLSQFTTKEIPSSTQEWIDLCHSESVNAGWYTDLSTDKPLNRNIPEMLALIHSELSEAFESFLNKTADDKLPHRSGVEVELADTLIRTYDLAGYKKLNLSTENFELSVSPSIDRFFNQCHLDVSRTLESYRKSNATQFEFNLAKLLYRITINAPQFKWDIPTASIEKILFNRDRADHKIENRKKDGGKKA